MEEEQGLMAKVMSSGKERIFLGGLGESVTSDDIRKIFMPLGRIEAIEIIRTKCRSIAYIDFFPSSDKSLSKLFSTYNGCRWKGGKLRVEKAKEHFLARLRREWDEDARLADEEPMADNSDAGKGDESPETHPKHPISEVKHLNIFFPGSRKVKSVPFHGTGKHRYSFRRVEVPPLPIHFCDCEEHSRPPISEEPAGGGMDEEEDKLTNSVIGQLLKRERAGVPSNASSYEREDGELVPNIAGQSPETSLDIEQSRLSGKVSSAHGVPRKKMKLDPDGATDAGNSGRNKKISLQQHENQGQQQSGEEEESTKPSSRGSAWRHQSSWTQLMNSNSSSFSISQILPNITYQREEPAADTFLKEVTNSAAIDGLSVAVEIDSTPAIVEQQSDGISPPTREPRMSDVALIETCSFVRTAASLREWSRTKAALTGSLKKTKSKNMKESRTGNKVRH